MTRLGIVPRALCVLAFVFASPAGAEIKFGNSNPSLITSSEPAAELGQRQVDLLYFLMSRLRPGDTAGILRARHLEAFYVADVDGQPGVSADDVAIFVARETAKKRGRLVGAMLEEDLDGDNIVTFDELLIAGRVSATQNGGRPSASGAGNTIHTPKQLALLAEAYAQRKLHELDLDGDQRLTLSDVDLRMAREPVIEPRRHTVPPDAFDANSDGRIMEAEMKAELGRWIAWLDMDRDGVISANEIKDRRTEVQRADQKLNRRAGPNQNRCVLPPIASADEVVVVHATKGSAFIDLTYGGDYAEPVYMGELVLPKGNAPLWIIASFGKSMLLRLDGDTERVAGIVSVAATTGVVGQPEKAQVVKTRCHAGFLGMRILEKGQSQSDAIAASFARALRRQTVPIYSQDTLGRLDLSSGQNDEIMRLAGDDTPEAQGDARYTKEALYFFSPGGFHDYAPSQIAVPKDTRVSERPLLPLEAGLLQLVENKLITPVVSARTGVSKRVPPGAPRPVPSAEEKSSRSPLIGGLLFHDVGDGALIGREPLTFAAHTKPRIPPGLTGKRGIRLLIVSGKSGTQIDTTPPSCRRRGINDQSPPSDDDCIR